MKIKETVVLRFKNLTFERGITYNELARISGLSPSTVYSMLDPNRKDLSILTIKKLCDGLEITMGEFFSTKEFDEIEQEIE